MVTIRSHHWPATPLVARAVLVQHHPHHRSARPLPAVRPAPGRRLDLAVRLQAQAKPVVAQLEAVLADQLLVEVLGREVRVARLEQLQHPHHLVHRRAARRDPPKAPVVQTRGTLGLIALPPAPERPLRHAQDLRGLGLAQITPITASVDILELHQSQSLQLLRPAYVNCD